MSKPLKILLVDDNPNDRQLVIHHLKEEFPQMQVTQIIAADGLAAALETGAFDLVITDFQIRWTTGLEVLQTVKARYTDCPVIMFTATGTQEVAVEAMKSGLDDYLIKAPAHFARLPVAVSSVLEKTQQKRTLRASEDRYRDLVENSRDLICTHDLQGVILSINPWSAMILGYEISDIVGENLLGFLEPEARPDFERYLAEIQQHGAAQGRMYVQTRSGERLIWEYNNTLRTEGIAEPVVRGMARDITERVQAQESLLERTEELELLYEAGQQLSQTLDTDTIYDTFYNLVSRVMECDSLAISSFDPKEKLIHCVYVVIEGHKQDASQLQPLPLNPESQGTQSVVIHTGKSLLIRDYQTRLQTSKKAFYMNDEGGVVDHNQAPDNAKVTHSAIVIPYKLQGLVTGVIQVMSYRLEAYSEADLRILESLASQIAVASNNALLYRQAQRRHRELALLNRVIAAASTTLEPKAVLETTCRELALAFGLPQVAAALLNEARTASVVVAEYLAEGHHSASALDVVIPLEGNPATQYVFEHKAPLAIADVQHDPRMAAIHDMMRQRGTISMLILPLMAHGQVVGTLGLDAVERREFSDEDIALAANAAAAAAQALENARLFSDAKRRLGRLGALHAIDQAISASVDINLTAGVFLDQVLTQLEVDAADVLLFDPFLQTLECVGRKGFRTSALQHTHLRLGQGLAGQVALQRKIKSIPDLQEEAEVFLASPELSGEKFRAYYGIPLVAKGIIKGVLEIFHRSPLSPDGEWLMFLKALAGQAAIAIDNAIMFTDLQRSNLELALAYDSTLEGWARALELRDMETEGHSRSVTEMTMRLARAMGIGGEALGHIRRGALLHDIGKMGVPDSILLKPGPLTDEEWVIMRQHPVYARDMLAPIAYLRRAIDIPYSHHEKWDGSGYPESLRGEQIPLSARIFAIVDVWDALNSDRPYREAWPEEKALAYIHEQSGKHFDPQVVDMFLQLIKENLP